jgi:hypothetical protein
MSQFLRPSLEREKCFQKSEWPMQMITSSGREWMNCLNFSMRSSSDVCEEKKIAPGDVKMGCPRYGGCFASKQGVRSGYKDWGEDIRTGVRISGLR